MKNLVKTLSFTFSLAVLFGIAAPALAYGPILSVSNNGSNTNITVSGANPYSSVELSYTSPGSSLPTTIGNFGTTDGNGYFVTSVSSSSYGISNGVSMYVTVGGVGGQQSNIVSVGSTGGCTYNCGSPYNFSLSQNSLSLNVGQTAYVTASNNSAGNLYISSNSNPSAVSATASGNQINFYGLTSGSSTVSVCSNYSSYSSGNCASVYVTVGGGVSDSGVSLSQTSLSLNLGQTGSINIYGGGGYGYFISTNSNPAVAITSRNGSVLNVYGGQAGSSTLQICQNNATSCASLYVTVGGTGSSVLGASIYPNGQLINDGGTVYITYKNTKTAFTSAAVFRDLGYRFSSVISGSTSGLSNSGYVIRTAVASHPWGSWIKSGSTVYFVHESGLIPVGDYNTFLNNGGSDSLVVPANTYDFQLPMLSVMTANDYRLK